MNLGKGLLFYVARVAAGAVIMSGMTPVGAQSPSTVDTSRGLVLRGTIVTMNDQHAVIKNGSLLVRDGIVAETRPTIIRYRFTTSRFGAKRIDLFTSSGNQHAFLLIPCDENHAAVEGCDYDLVDEEAATRENPASVMQKQPTTAPSTPALNGPSNDVRTVLRGRLGSGHPDRPRYRIMRLDSSQ